jgi:dephospho-CoA kinase
MAYQIGITGGIGSGKTTVCRIFESMGIPVYYADDWAKWLIMHDHTLKQGMVVLFGPDVYGPDGSYNRQLVSKIVFSNPEKRLAINALVHPAVLRHGEHWHAENAAKGVPYTLKEAALMIESGSYKALDALIVVTAPEDIRIARVAVRDGLPEEQVWARISAQLSESELLAYADFWVQNDGEQALIPQVWAIHQKLLSASFPHLEK